MNTIKIVVIDDGSHSLLNEAMDETYHSRHGAVQESLYVFIERGLNYVAEKQNPKNYFDSGCRFFHSATKKE